MTDVRPDPAAQAGAVELLSVEVLEERRDLLDDAGGEDG